MALTHKTDLATVAKSRVVSQYRNAPLFVALMAAIANVVQLAEDAFWDLANAVLLDSATGVWLEYLGSIVGEAREGWGDTDYRRFIRARILANRSSGTINEVLTVVALCYDADITTVFITSAEFYPASMLLLISTVVTTTAAWRARTCRIASYTRAAGVRLLINSSEFGVSNSFVLSDSGSAQPVININEGFTDSGDPSSGGRLVSGDLA